VSLVVGTSGGAINALAVALGITKEPQGRELLGTLWANFDLRDFIVLWPKSGLTLGLCAALAISSLVLIFVPDRRAASIVLLGFGSLGLFFGFGPFDLLAHVPVHHWLGHGIVILTFAARWGSWWMFGFAAIMWFIQDDGRRLRIGRLATSFAWLSAAGFVYF